MTEEEFMAAGAPRKEILLTDDLNCLPNNAGSAWSREVALADDEHIRIALRIAAQPEVRYAGALVIVQLAIDGYTDWAWEMPFALDASDAQRQIVGDAPFPTPRSFQLRATNRTGVPLAAQGSTLEAWIYKIEASA